MKESKKECAKPNPPPKPNLKNKDFIKWSRAESCKKDDNIVSTDWHEKLQKIKPFSPVYNNVPLNMVYLLSGEYGRIWQKERDEWYSNVFVLNKKDQDMDNRKKKIRKEIRAAKKAAEANIKERKERRAKEAEIKAKAEAEKAEKLKTKLQKCEAKKKQKKQKQEAQEPSQPSQASPESAQTFCPKDWRTVELKIQCECSNHKKEANEEKREQRTDETLQQEKLNLECDSSGVCEGYYNQLKGLINTNKEAQDSKIEINQATGNTIKSEIKTCQEN